MNTDWGRILQNTIGYRIFGPFGEIYHLIHFGKLIAVGVVQDRVECRNTKMHAP